MVVTPRVHRGHPSRAPSSTPPAAARAAAPPARALPSDTRVQHPLPGAIEVNERCIEMLVLAARHEEGRPFGVVSELRELLKSANPSMRQRAARRAFLLVDMEFGNSDFWNVVCSHPSQQLKTPLWRGSFPRASAIQLARQTLMLAWNSLRTDPAIACILLGTAQPVAEIIASLRFDEIDRIAHRRFRHVRPRWDDRPGVWRRLLVAAQSDDENLMSAVNLHGLQLLTGELLAER